MNKIIIFVAFAVILTTAYLFFAQPQKPADQLRLDPDLVGNRQAAETSENSQSANKLTDSNNMKDAKIQWFAKKIVGSSKHNGTVELETGEFEMSQGEIVGGNFTIDMTSIKNEDLSSQAMKDKLIGHLKSDDFFSVEKHPQAVFSATNIEKIEEDQYQITGDLTIKGITNPISFPATITTAGNSIVADARFSIDRTQWDVRYGSNTFFGNLGDQAIDDMIDFDIHLES